MLSLGERTTWALVHSGKIKSFKVGASRRVTHSALTDYVAQREAATVEDGAA